MEYLDVVDEKGRPTGGIVSREEAHEKGVRHRTSHVWLLRMKDGELQVLLQKRSDGKDSFPGCYDISSAGHIPAGEEPLPSALRELYEELGVSCRAEDLHYCGQCVIGFDREFRGKVFRDRQVSSIYILWLDREEDQFILLEEEILLVRRFDFD
jgi:8-oxo-dGTP pyrophosphatase MutT (NUDIX family)